MSRRCLLGSLVLCGGLAAQQATFTTYGAGCYRQRQSFYELFPSGTFDLGGTLAAPGGFSMIFIGDGWLVLPLLNTWHTPTGAAVNVWSTPLDDTVSGAVPLGFTMPYPGGTTDNLWVSSNGFAYLQADTVNGCCNGDAALLLSGGHRLCMLWTDLNPSQGGSVTIDRDATASIAYLTFDSVREYNSSNLNTFQVAFHSWGSIDVLYGPCSYTAHTALVGWSRGAGALNPGATDLSAALPIVTGTDSDPLSLSSTGRPRINTMMPLVTSNIPAGSSTAMLLLSATQHAAGLDLGQIGMSGCSQYVGDLSLQTYTVVGAGSTATLQLFVPNSMGLVGQVAFCQSVALAPQLNTLGWIASNGARLLVGTF